MAVKFNHKGEILAIREGFPKYYMKYAHVKVNWEAVFTENDFRNAQIIGTGKNEKLVLSTKILVGSKGISIKFIEDVEGKLDIEVNEKKVYTIRPRGRISQSLLDAFTCAIMKEQQ